MACGAVLVAGWLLARPYVSVRGGLWLHANARGAEVRDFALRSRALGRTVMESAVVPSGAPRRGAPLLLLLHGRGTDQHALASGALFDALHDLRSRAPVVVLVDGGDHSYFHDRRSGRWGTYLLRDVLPAAIDRLRADRRRVAIGGISMGGFGALEAARARPGRFCAVGGHSAAVFSSAGATAAGAFDDGADFARHDLLSAARPGLFGATRVRLGAGDADPFRPALRTLAARLGVPLHGGPGGHDSAYWERETSRYLRFYADALARC